MAINISLRQFLSRLAMLSLLFGVFPAWAGIVTQVATARGTAGNHQCALTDVGEVYCWGGNNSGQLGTGDTLDHSGPVKVEGLPSPAISIVTFNEGSCALLADGGLRCWGNTSSLAPTSLTPVLASGLDKGVKAIAFAGYSLVAVFDDGAVACRPWLWWGCSGNYEFDAQKRRVLQGFPHPVKSIATGPNHTCAITEDDSVYCWGKLRAYPGAISTQTEPPNSQPFPVWLYIGGDDPVEILGPGGGIKKLVINQDLTCVLTKSGAVTCWGLEVYGLGSSPPTRSFFSPVTEGATALQGSTLSRICAVVGNSEVKCWSGNTLVEPYQVLTEWPASTL